MIAENLQSGRLVDVINSGEPAVMVCHWPGIYFNGEKVGFNILKKVKKRLDQKYTNLIWMKLSEIARYWAARELTTIKEKQGNVKMKAPFPAPGFAIKIDSTARSVSIKNTGPEIIPLTRVKDPLSLKSNTWFTDRSGTVICFDLGKGETEIIVK